jgi:multiple sugar transport system permease protein
MATIDAPIHETSWTPRRQMRNFTAGATVTLFGFLILIVFLMPIGYMGITAFKSQSQVLDPNSMLMPVSPDLYSYAGQDYQLYQVPMPDGTIKIMALVDKQREQSGFIDPRNPSIGEITWIGRWRTLQPSQHFDPTYTNFTDAWNAINMGILFRNSFIIAILGTLGTLLSSICVAYGFARFRIPYGNAIFMVLIATIILPSQVTLIPTYTFFRAIGWSGSLAWLPLIVPHFFANAYNVFLLRQYFRVIPKDMDEAAMMDGASPIQVLLRVIIPQSWPVILAVGLFHFFWSWNDFFTPLVYLQGNESMYTIPIGLTQFNNIYSVQPGLAMSAAIMAIALPVVIFFLAQRVFMQGIVITGVEN